MYKSFVSVFFFVELKNKNTRTENITSTLSPSLPVSGTKRGDDENSTVN